MQLKKNITFICITLKKKFSFETDMDRKWEIKLYAKASFSFLKFCVQENVSQTQKSKLVTKSQVIILYICPKASICSSIVLESHRLKTVYYINKLHL